MKHVNLVKTAVAAYLVSAMFSLVACSENSSNSNNSVDTVGSDALFQQKNIGDFELKNSKKIVLTFDDGPSEHTMTLLNILRQHNIKATFFVLAKNVPKFKSTLEQMIKDGHTVANHSYDHDALNKSMYTTDPKALLREVVDSDSVISPYMVPSKPRYFRAPFGAWTSTHAARLNKIPQVSSYIGPVFWTAGGQLLPNLATDPVTKKLIPNGTRGSNGKVSARPSTKQDIVASADWDCWGASTKLNYKPLSVDVCMAGYLKEIDAKQGAVVLMHDLTANTVEMTRRMIPELIARGYSFTNLEDLRSLEKYQDTFFEVNK